MYLGELVDNVENCRKGRYEDMEAVLPDNDLKGSLLITASSSNKTNLHRQYRIK